MRQRSVVTSITLAASLLVAAAPSVMAECTWPPPTASETFDARFAFSATATEVSGRVPAAPSGQPPWEWHVVLTIDHIHRGKVPAQITLNGRNGDCHSLLGGDLRQGDRLFVALDQVGLQWGGFYGPMLLWRGTSDGWSFYADVLTYGSDTRFYPTIARQARTSDEVLHVISATPPDTATSAGENPGAPDQPLLLVAVVFAAAFVAALKRIARVASS